MASDFDLSDEQRRTWQRFQGAFDPWRPSLPQDIAHIYVERPGGPAERLLRQFDLLGEHQCYANGDVWFRPHELLVGWLSRLASERASRAESP